MKTTATAIRHQYNENGTPEIILTCPDKSILSEIPGLKSAIADGKRLDVEVKIHRNRRSLDANAYCWIMCQKIAEVIRSTKEEVYRKAIREVGQFTIVPVKNGDPLETWIRNWQSRGLGWICETMDSKLEGYTNVVSYYGSSVYDTKSMSILIDNIVQDAKELGIETLTPSELERMKQEWGG